MAPPETAVQTSQSTPETLADPICSSTLKTVINQVEFHWLKDPDPAADLKSDPKDKKLPGNIDALLSNIGKRGTVTVSEVCIIRAEAIRRLEKAGYIAIVQIPWQPLDDGVLKLDVVLARVAQVRLDGDAGPYEAFLDKRIDDLTKMVPFNRHRAERILLIANEIPGLTAHLNLRRSPDGSIGVVVGDLRVSYEPVVLIANAQNYGSRQLGRETGSLSATFNGLTGLADQTVFAVSSTADLREQNVLQLGHRMGIGRNGFTVGLQGLLAWSRPELGPLDLRSLTTIATFDMGMPLVRTVENALRIDGGIDFLNQRTRVYSGGNSLPLNRDTLRVAFLRLDGEHQRFRYDPIRRRSSEAHYLAGSVAVRQGLQIFGASEPGAGSNGYALSRPDGDPQATVISGDLRGRLWFGDVFGVAGAAEGQWANHPLLNLEEYSIGNLTIGRGYDPGANSGDRAVAARVELRAHPPARLRSDRYEIEAFGFYDNVWLWNLDPNSTENKRLLRSYGGGLRLRVPGLLALEATYAHPRDPALRLTNAPPPPDRFLLSLTFRFAPKFRGGPHGE